MLVWLWCSGLVETTPVEVAVRFILVYHKKIGHVSADGFIDSQD